MTAHPICLAVAVDASALDSLLREGDIGGYRDSHPWYVAAELLASAHAAGETLYLLLAAGAPLRLRHWAEVEQIEVHAHASRRDTRVRLGSSGPVSPVFEALESVTLVPGAHQLERERREGLRVRRLHLDESWLRPYAICETPPFLLRGAS